MKNFKKLKILITGSSKGIGLSIAKKLSKNKNNLIYINGRNKNNLLNLRRLCDKHGIVLIYDEITSGFTFVYSQLHTEVLDF